MSVQTNPATPNKVRIVIAGAGFAGIRAARRLSRHAGLEVTLISPEDTFTYYPQLYHAATGGTRKESALPLTEVLAGCPVQVVKARLASFDPAAHTVATDTGQTLPYNKLILALGSVTNYFGIPGLAEFSYDIKSINGAERFKQHLHQQLTDQHAADLNYAIVGGGPTGIELAGALSDYLERIVRSHGITKPNYQIELIEAAPSLLPRMPAGVGTRVQTQLEDLGVRVMTGSAVEGETADSLNLKGEKIHSKTVVWTAGVANNPFFKDNASLFTLAKNGKVEVNEYLESQPDVYIAGDNAATQFSGMAQTALYDADFIVNDIFRQQVQQIRKTYKAKSPISAIPVGNGWAVVLWGPLKLYGALGWILRRLADLIGYADIEGWGPKAVRVWLADGRREDNCPVCQK